MDQKMKDGALTSVYDQNLMYSVRQQCCEHIPLEEARVIREVLVELPSLGTSYSPQPRNTIVNGVRVWGKQISMYAAEIITPSIIAPTLE
jgi:hypothetical protein